MLGRAAYHDPWVLAQTEHALFGTPLPERSAVLDGLRGYVERELGHGVHLNHIGRHILGLYAGQPGARAYRRHLSENMHRAGAVFEVIEQASAHLQHDAAA
jgi:tRNA-dihydrouridine synthase A